VRRMSAADDAVEGLYIALTIAKRQNQRHVGAAVHRRLHRTGMEDEVLYSIELFDFLDNEHFSNIDSFLVQMGQSIVYLSEDYENVNKGDGKKLHNICEGKGIENVFVKRGLFSRREETSNTVGKLCGKQTHVTNVAETESPLGYLCIECLVQSLRLMDIEDNMGKYELRLGSLSKYMRIDSAAAEAVNLLPKPDHPSQFGSIFGVLNRCKTKMGSRLLERWLRQPLLDTEEINSRLDLVEALKDSTLHRNQICDGPLKGVPDLDLVVAKMQKKTAGLSEVFKLYVFTRSLPTLMSVLNELVDSLSMEVTDADALSGEDNSDGSSDKKKSMAKTIRSKFIEPLDSISGKFSVYQQLVEHVIDLEKLPELVINPKHDPELQELHEEQVSLEAQADKLVREARNGWASFANIQLEMTPQHGFVFRTPKGDDERQLRANNSSVRIIAIKKVRISDQHHA
jgi:DNA mismatch repair protein MSH2